MPVGLLGAPGSELGNIILGLSGMSGGTVLELIEGFASWTDSDNPSVNHGNDTYVYMDSAVPKYAYFWFAGVPTSGTVLDAYLLLYLGDDFAGGEIVTVSRVLSSWSQWVINFNNAPEISESNQGSAEVVNTPYGSALRIPLTPLIGDVVALGRWFGLRIEIDSTGTPYDFTSINNSDLTYRPRLVIQYVADPNQPTNLVPSEGQQVSTEFPTLSWRWSSIDGEDALAYRIQIDDTDENFGSIELDTGWQYSPDTIANLADLGYIGIPDGETRYWRVKVKNLAGKESEWSGTTELGPAAAIFGRTAKNVAALTSPDDETDTTMTPITHTWVGPNTQTATEYFLEVLGSDSDWHELWHRERAATTDLTATIPAGYILSEDATYRVRALIWDDVNRVATPGDPIYTELIEEFVLVEAGSPPESPEDLTATPDDDTANVLLEWSADSEPDFWVILLDGVLVEIVTGSSASVGGDDYEYLYTGLVTPGLEQDFAVRAMSSSGEVDASPDSPAPATVSAGTLIIGGIRIKGTGNQPFSRDATEEIYFPPGETKATVLQSAIHDVGGTVSGWVASTSQAKAIRDMRGTIVQVIAAGMSSEGYVTEAPVSTRIMPDGSCEASVTVVPA